MTSAFDLAAHAFLVALTAPTTDGMKLACRLWTRQESGAVIVGNNAWNLHAGPANVPGGTRSFSGPWLGCIGNRYAGPDDRNVAIFDTVEHGAQAAARNLINAGESYGYGAVVRAARAGTPEAFLRALGASGWSASGYGDKLLAAYKLAGGPPDDELSEDPMTDLYPITTHRAIRVKQGAKLYADSALRTVFTTVAHDYELGLISATADVLQVADGDRAVWMARDGAVIVTAEHAVGR